MLVLTIREQVIDFFRSVSPVSNDTHELIIVY